MTLKSAQKKYKDAIQCKAALVNSNNPIGAEGLNRLLTGGRGKVLFYNHGKTTERIIVSEMAAKEPITTPETATGGEGQNTTQP